MSEKELTPREAIMLIEHTLEGKTNATVRLSEAVERLEKLEKQFEELKKELPHLLGRVFAEAYGVDHEKDIHQQENYIINKILEDEMK